MMQQQRMLLPLLIVVSLLFLAGCSFLGVPKQGAQAKPDSWSDLEDIAGKKSVFKTDDMNLEYQLTQIGNRYNLVGELSIDRSITDSFTSATYFILMMNFLDINGKVLDSVDLTPLASVDSVEPEAMKVKGSGIIPAGATKIVFSYYGDFKGEGGRRSTDEWEIYYYPFE